MTANVNPKTGIRYGTIYANHVMDFYIELMERGTDLSFQAYVDEIVAKIKSALEELNIAAEMRTAQAIYDHLAEHGLNDYYECDEPSYEYKYQTAEGEVCVQMTHLGGAALIYVIESPWVVNCRGCSPCCPNAGDLDSPDEDGRETYCLDPANMPEGYEGSIRLLPK